MGGQSGGLESYRLGKYSCFYILNFVLFWVYANQFVPSPFLPQVLKDKGLSESTIGLFFSLFPAASFIASFMCSPVVRKLGPELGCVIALCFMSVFTFLFTLDDPPLWIYFVLRSLQGASTALFTDCIYVMVGVIFPDELAYYIGLIEACISLGCSLGRAVGGWMYAAGGFDIPFIIVSILLMVSAISIFAVFVPAERLGIKKISPLRDALLSEQEPLFTEKNNAANGAPIAPSRSISPDASPTRNSHVCFDGGTVHPMSERLVLFENKQTARERFSSSHAHPNDPFSIRHQEIGLEHHQHYHHHSHNEYIAPTSNNISPILAEEQIKDVAYWDILNARTWSIGFCVAVSATTYTFFDPVLAEHLQNYFGPLSQANVGAIMGLQSAVYMVAAAITGLIASKGPQYYLPTSLLGLVLSACGFFLLGPSPVLRSAGFVERSTLSWISQLVGQSVLAFGNAFSFVPALPWLQNEVRHLGPAGQEHTCAMVVGFMSLGEAIAPLVSGFLTEKHGYQWACTAFSFLFAIYLIHLWVIFHAHPKSAADLAEEDEEFVLGCKGPALAIDAAVLGDAEALQTGFVGHHADSPSSHRHSCLEMHEVASSVSKGAAYNPADDKEGSEGRKSWVRSIVEFAAASGPRSAEILQAIAQDPDRVLIATAQHHSHGQSHHHMSTLATDHVTLGGGVGGELRSRVGGGGEGEIDRQKSGL